ncbi:GNAT family N-acetyltransferase [Marinobacter halodurans]|uniref:GNAT family N-acetyltransferase n=1 Tax=Marinobacter halodurans TaxID=2528979 RepID=UPI001A95551A|nr:GNAT family protein [Marinobacter halodurans]
MVIDHAIELQLLNPDHRDELFELIDTNRAHLREWLPWVDANRSPADSEAFIASAIRQYESGKGPQYAIYYSAVLAGVCGFHPLDVTNRIGGIGYWLGEAYSGLGIMTSTVRTLVGVGFQRYDLNRIEIACASNNTRSRAIPERLGFRFEGVLREREYLYGKYVDHAFYSLLASEFPLEGASA